MFGLNKSPLQIINYLWDLEIRNKFNIHTIYNGLITIMKFISGIIVKLIIIQ